MSSQPTWITPAGSLGTYPEGQALDIQFQAIPADQSSGRLGNVLLGQIDTIVIANSGSGYLSSVPPVITVTNAAGDTFGSNAAFRAVVNDTTGAITNLVVTDYGNNYTLPPNLTISAPPAGSITSVTVSNTGANYQTNPRVSFSATAGTLATATASITANIAALTVATITVQGVTQADIGVVTYSGNYRVQSGDCIRFTGIAGMTQLNNLSLYALPTSATTFQLYSDAQLQQFFNTANLSPYVSGGVGTVQGSNYQYAPGVSVTGGSNRAQAAATAVISGTVSYIEVIEQVQYASAPVIVINGGGGAGATAQAVLDDSGYLTAVVVTNAGLNYTSAPPVIVDGQTGVARAYISAQVTGYVLTSQGTTYGNAPPPTITVSGGGGTGATAAVTANNVQNGSVVSINVVSTGTGYQEPPLVTFSGGNVDTAVASATISGSVASVSVTATGTGYTAANTSVSFSGGGGSSAAAVPVINLAGQVVAVTVTNAGTGYTSAPAVTITSTDAGAAGATARSRISAVLTGASVVTSGSGYTQAPEVSVVAGGIGSGAALVPRLAGAVSAITVTSSGTGYLTSPLPTVTITPAPGDTTGSGAAATAVVTNWTAQARVTLNRGQGYTSIPQVTVTRAPGDNYGSGATAVAGITGNAVSFIQVTNAGSGYTLPPVVTVAPPAQQTKLVTLAATNTTLITLNDVTNLGAGMSAQINSNVYQIVSVQSIDKTISISAPATVTVNQIITFTGLQARPVSTLVPTQVTYTLQSGTLPKGIPADPVRLTSSGLLLGTPAEVSETTTSAFTIRARDVDNNIRDRVFSLSVAGPDVPIFLTESGIILNLLDSVWTSYQVLYTTPDPVEVVVTVDSGELPPGLYLSTSGLITGYAEPPTNDFNTPVTATSTFVLRITKVNTTQSSTRQFSIVVKNQSASPSTQRVPAILNNNPLTPVPRATDPYFDFYFSGTNLGTYTHNNYFAYKFIGYDFDNAGGAIQNTSVIRITVTNPGSGYSLVPAVTITRAAGDFSGTGATARAQLDIATGTITGILITNRGYNYTLPPEIRISPPPSGTRAEAVASLDAISVVSQTNTIPSQTINFGYSTVPAVTISAPDFVNGVQATAQAVVVGGRVTRIITTNPGAGYTVLPTVTVAPPVPLTKTVVNTVAAQTDIVLSDTDNLVPLMTASYSGTTYTITAVNSGTNTVTLDTAITITAAANLTFVGRAAQASLILEGNTSGLTIQYALDGLAAINGTSNNLTFDIYSGWVTGYLPDIGASIRTYQLTAYVLKNSLISSAYKFDITIEGDVNTAITWQNQNSLLGTLYNGEISYLGIAAQSGTSEIEYRLAPLITKNLNAITWGPITRTAQAVSDTSGLASVWVEVSAAEIELVSIGSTVTYTGAPTPYTTVVEIQPNALPFPRFRMSAARAIAALTNLTFTRNAYVAVGDEGVIQYSLINQNNWYPGNTATSSDYSTLANFVGIAWFNTLKTFIAVGNLSRTPVIFTSINAVDWYQENVQFNFAFYDIAVGFPNGQETICCATASGKVFVGNAPNNLVQRNVTTSDITAVTWDQYNQQFVAVAQNGYIATSPDGSAWTERTRTFPRYFGQPPDFVPVRFVKNVDPAVVNSNTLTLSNSDDIIAGQTITIGSFTHTVLGKTGLSVLLNGPPVTLAQGTTAVFNQVYANATPYSYRLLAVAAQPTGTVISISVLTPGSNYTRPPDVTFTGGGGAGATAVAILGTGGTAGQVVSILVLSSGSGYTSSPNVVVTRAAGDTTGAGCTAGATTAAALVATGAIRWFETSSEVSLILTSTNAGVTWTAQPAFKERPSLTQSGTIADQLIAVTYNPVQANRWIISSAGGATITGSHLGSTTVDNTANLVNNVPALTVPGSWTNYKNDAPYTILGLWSRPITQTQLPAVLSSGTVGIIQETATALTPETWTSINVQSLPRSLQLLTTGEISGRVAFVPTDIELTVGTKLRYEFVVQAYNTATPEISTTRQFAIDIVILWDQPFETLYMKCLPSASGRGIWSSLTSLVSSYENYIYRNADPYYGVSNNIIYQHEFGVHASSLAEYIDAEQRNFYWRNLVLGELQTARAIGPDGAVIYEVVYSAIQDSLVNAKGQSADLVIQAPRPINLNLGSWYDSLTYQYTSYVYAVPTLTRTTSGTTNSTVIPLNSTTGITRGMVITGIGVTNADGSTQQSGRINGSGEPSVVAVNEFSVTVNQVQTLASGTVLRFSTPDYYTARTPGEVTDLYPASLPNMRTRIDENLGKNTSDTILPRWMTSQQANGNTLGYVPAVVICYTKPGYSETIKNAIQSQWPYKLNQIDFDVDRFEVDKSATYNWDNSLIPPDWSELPSSGQQSVTDNRYDLYVLFPQKTVLPR